MNTLRSILLIGFVAIIISLYSCAEQGEAEIPSYLVIDSVNVMTDNGEGSESARIPFIWLYVDNDFLGGYPVGEKIPILKEGNVEIELRPGIYTNGQVTRTDVYNLMGPTEKIVELQQGETTRTDITFSYVEEAQFPVVEGFEDGNVFKEDLDDNNSTFLERIESDVFEGDFAGELKVNPADSVNAIAMIDPVDEFFNFGELMYCEFDYKGSTDLVVGIAGINSLNNPYNIAKISLKPRDTFRKIYIDFTPEVQENRAISVSVFLLTAYNGQYEGDTQSAIIDNFKLVHF